MKSTSKKKLSPNQIFALETLVKYNCEIMCTGFVTGGHGIKINKNTVASLETMGLIRNGALTDLGKTYPIN